jgi:hypothetical protein
MGLQERIAYHHEKGSFQLPGQQPGGHGGGDPAIQAEFLRRVRTATPCCPGVLGARNAIAIAATHASETHQPQNIPPAPLHPDDATR